MKWIYQERLLSVIGQNIQSLDLGLTDFHRGSLQLDTNIVGPNKNKTNQLVKSMVSAILWILA